ncbi:uncharacterized protein N7529_009722 [Penicillium soppii]|uniref:uncharacterized protein n=1 Tax=Penicillium soppii TaxID=69789 RepID=UPI0025490435|nr:uncharacterized protein N7529_009722 [Penicillium soppii]KAJ5855778.1 hypothetical protein N7529_009722 [Penicillium soppii]
MSLSGKVVLLTGASMGIGEAIASSLVEAGANLILFSRSELKERLSTNSNVKIIYRTVDVGDFHSVDKAVASSAKEMGEIDILINNVISYPSHQKNFNLNANKNQAGLALGAPKSFHELTPSQIMTMNNTNINGYMFMSHAVLNHSMLHKKEGTILNVTSITGLEVPPFPGEAVYHANKACQEAFTNSLRNELSGSNIRVLALRPGCVATNFHSLRAAVYMLQLPINVSIKALDIVPSAQRSLSVFDRMWNERQT